MLERVKTIAAVLAAICAASAAASTSAADRIIPAGSTGPLAGWAGKPWWDALAYCSATQSRQVDWMKAAEVPEGVTLFRGFSVAYLEAAARRVQADRGLDYAAALDVAAAKA